MDRFSKKKRSEIMADIHSSRTSPERTFHRALRELGLRFRRNVKGLTGSPDAVLDGLRIAIFVNGCFWHSHAKCPRAALPETNRAFWKKKIDGNRKRDKRVAYALRKDGWTVLTFWTCKRISAKSVESRLSRTCGHN